MPNPALNATLSALPTPPTRPPHMTKHPSRRYDGVTERRFRIHFTRRPILDRIFCCGSLELCSIDRPLHASSSTNAYTQCFSCSVHARGFVLLREQTFLSGKWIDGVNGAYWRSGRHGDSRWRWVDGVAIWRMTRLRSFY